MLIIPGEEVGGNPAGAQWKEAKENEENRLLVFDVQLSDSSGSFVFPPDFRFIRCAFHALFTPSPATGSGWRGAVQCVLGVVELIHAGGRTPSCVTASEFKAFTSSFFLMISHGKHHFLGTLTLSRRYF